MVWTTDVELQQARLADPFAQDSLFTKANDAGIPRDDSAGILNNTQLLTKLVDARKITSGEVGEIQTKLTAGANLLGTLADFASNLTTVLLFSSMPETYAYSDIAQQLAATGRLTDKDRAGIRLGETDTIIQAIMTGLASGDGDGLHRAFLLGVRHQGLSNVWSTRGKWINQVSLAFTLLTFSYTPFEAMARGSLSVPDPDQRLAWLKMWNVVGSLLGIGPGGLPATVDEAEALTKLIRDSGQYIRTPEGQVLITALVELKNENTARFFRFGGEALMTLLGVKRPPTP